MYSPSLCRLYNLKKQLSEMFKDLFKRSKINAIVPSCFEHKQNLFRTPLHPQIMSSTFYPSLLGLFIICSYMSCFQCQVVHLITQNLVILKWTEICTTTMCSGYSTHIAL